jgi:Protein of unknown function (DUF726)
LRRAHGAATDVAAGHVTYIVTSRVAARADGIIEHVVLMGAPVSVEADRLRMMRAVTAGRVVNAYSRADWLLALQFRCDPHTLQFRCDPDTLRFRCARSR